MNTRLNLLAAVIFLAVLGTGSGQPVITNQPQTQATAPGTTVAFAVGGTGIPGQPGTTSNTDPNAAGASPLFYRVGVGN